MHVIYAYRPRTVHTLASGAFEGGPAETMILPESIRTVEPGTFRGAALRVLYLFDSVRSISDYSLDGCDRLETLHLNAATAPSTAAATTPPLRTNMTHKTASSR